MSLAGERSSIPTEESQDSGALCKAAKHDCDSPVLIDMADGL